MRQDIIDQMQANLGNGTWAYKDFEMDKTSLHDYDGIFFWISREDGTGLCKVDFRQIMHQMYESERAEANRIAWFQDFYIYVAGIMYWAEDKANKLYYYDCNTLVQVDLETARNIYERLLGSLYKKLKDDSLHEYRMANKRIPIKVECRISTLKEALYYAESLNDSSLIECLRRLRNYRRCAVDQSVYIYKDFSKYSFTFSNTTDKEQLLVGGIVMHGYKNENRWQIHT